MRASILLVLALGAAAARADEAAPALKPGFGSEQVADNCGACHSLDYVEMNAGFLSQKGWDAEVTKMIKAFGAPIDDADAKAIKAYLTTNYGK